MEAVYKSEFYKALEEALSRTNSDEIYVQGKIGFAISRYGVYLHGGYGEDFGIKKVLWELFDEDIQSYVLKKLKIQK